MHTNQKRFQCEIPQKVRTVDVSESTRRIANWMDYRMTAWDFVCPSWELKGKCDGFFDTLYIHKIRLCSLSLASGHRCAFSVSRQWNWWSLSLVVRCAFETGDAIKCSICDTLENGESCRTHPPAPVDCPGHEYCIAVARYSFDGQWMGTRLT